MPKRADIAWWEPEPASPPLSTLTVGQTLDKAAVRFGGREAVVTNAYGDLGFNVRWTYKELKERADRLARGLLALGLQPGTRVAVWAPNVPEWLAVEFAAAKAGLVLVTVNPTYRAEELRFVLENSDAQALFFLPRIRHFDLASHLAAVRGSLPHLRHVFSLGETETGAQPLASLYQLGEGVPDSTLREREAGVDPHDVVQIQYTSGTTGVPKGAMLTHHGIVNDARLFAQRWAVSPDDRWCNPMPLFHTAGCAMVTLAAVQNGACHLPIVWFDPARIFETIKTERATILETVPTMVIGLLARGEEMHPDMASLRLVGTGGSPTPEDLGRRVRVEWGAELRIVYGITETSPLISSVTLDDPEEKLFTTVGQPFPETEVKIVRRDGEPAGTGEPGELWVRGYLVMAGYFKRPEVTRQVVDAEGWFHTGDVASMDEDGFLRIVGRVKDIIIRGGENLYPAEIESLLIEHPAVLEASVVGVPDPYYGEEACAALRTVEPVEPEAIKGWLRERVTHQKVPRYVVIVEEYPLTASGKIQKFRLRDQMAADLGLPTDAATEPAR